MITLFQKLVANRRRIFTFLGAYKGDNALLTVNDYNHLIDQLNYNAGRKVAVSVLKRFTGIEPPPGVYARLLSTGGGCLVETNSECQAGTEKARNYKPAKGASLVRNAAGVYRVDLLADGFGDYAHVSVEISSLSRVGSVKQTPIYSELNPNLITGYEIKCYDEKGELDDLPLINALMTTTYYAKFLTPVNQI